jgi:hypothetical protein
VIGETLGDLYTKLQGVCFLTFLDLTTGLTFWIFGGPIFGRPFFSLVFYFLDF